MHGHQLTFMGRKGVVMLSFVVLLVQSIYRTSRCLSALKLVFDSLLIHWAVQNSSNPTAETFHL